MKERTGYFTSNLNNCCCVAVGVMCLFFKTALGDQLSVGMVQEILRKREGMLAQCVLLCQDNVHAHMAQVDMAQESVGYGRGILTRFVLHLQDNVHSHITQVGLVDCEEEERYFDSRRSVLTGLCTHIALVDMTQEIISKSREILTRCVRLLRGKGTHGLRWHGTEYSREY